MNRIFHLLSLISITILFLVFSCDGNYSKTIIQYKPLEISIFKPSPNSGIYHLVSNNHKINEDFILEIFKDDSTILVKSYKNKNGYVDNDSSFIYHFKKITVDDIEISEEEYKSKIKDKTNFWNITSE